MDLYKAAFDGSPDMVVCVDPGGRIVEANRMCEESLGYAEGEMKGMPVEKLVPERFRPLHPAYRAGYQAGPKVRPMGSGRVLFAARKDGTEIPVDVMLSPAGTAAGSFVIAVLRDVSAMRESERRAEGMVAKLQQALRENKVLRGMLPICSYCKRIRNESGTWESVEGYMIKRSDLQFSHGICEDCLKKHFPDFFPAGRSSGT